MTDPLSLPEQFLLLCLNDETGKLDENHVGIGLNGAVLLELLLSGRIRLDEKSLVVEDQTPTGDELLDRTLALMARVSGTHPEALEHSTPSGPVGGARRAAEGRRWALSRSLPAIPESI